MSILYKAKPDDVKLILIDPKKVEFAVFRDLPHLYCPLISDPQKAAGALNSAVNEMERRFGLIEEVGVRNIASYNEITAGDPARPPLPRMVIVIDELADLMMTASNDVETAICRLAQKGRAAGMHLILGTQRPSTDVITGLIKANVPSRIAFTVKQQIDSRIIIDAVGAEKLIGRGDMLYAPVGETKPLRVQGAFVSDAEVERVVSFIREHNERGEFDENFTREIEIEAAKCTLNKKKKGEQVSIDDFDGLGSPAASKDDLKMWEAMEFIVGQKRIGTSAFQRHLGLGYGRAAKIIDRLEALGFIGPDDGKKQGRPVYLTASQLAEYRMNGLPGSDDDD
jgi:S-DNA-T family DNA segregation ATPase FtsK/SpoIIIE